VGILRRERELLFGIPGRFKAGGGMELESEDGQNFFCWD
jgi:hypothetical protein